MEKETVTLGVANLGEKTYKISDITNWEPKKITRLTNATAFEVDGVFYTMENSDFEKIFKQKVN
jgi:hypothetical protein